MKQRICSEVVRFVRSYEMRPDILTRWGEPIVGFAELNPLLVGLIAQSGGCAALLGAAAGFSADTLMSSWSHRHVAVLAGLGTFGANNMLITRAGSCGRVSSFAARVPVVPDAPLSEELCLYKRAGGKCFSRCRSHALGPEGFDHKRCFAVCMENEVLYPGC